MGTIFNYLLYFSRFANILGLYDKFGEFLFYNIFLQA